MQQYERPVLTPNLPENTVLSAAVNINAYKAIKSLINQGIRPIIIDRNNNISSSVSSHPDIRLFHFRNNEIYTESTFPVGELTDFFKIRNIRGVLANKYPEDVLLDGVSVGNKIICNKRTIAKEILDKAEQIGMTLIDCKQGYTKCSVCPVTDNFIITDDLSVYKSAQNFFDEVLLISKGSIRLKGMNYGFIGGTTGKLDKNILAFNGRIESHQDHNLIIDTLNRHSIKIIELSDELLEDIGSIIPLTEKVPFNANT